MSSQSTTTRLNHPPRDGCPQGLNHDGGPAGAKAATRVDRRPYDLAKLKRYLERAARDGDIRACYEASGAGDVLQRTMHAWGYACEVIAPSLIPKRPGVQRKHDKYDASELARLSRSGDLTAVRNPSEAEERVRDVVRCRETFQRDIPARDSQVAPLHPDIPRAAWLRESRGHELVHTASEMAAASDDGGLAARADGEAPAMLPRHCLAGSDGPGH